MEFLGIGPLELVFILLIALIVLGPNDMVKAGRTIGRFLRKVVTSPTWRTVQQTSRDLRYLPNKLMREAGLEDLKDQLPDATQIRKELNIDEIKKDKERIDKEISRGLSDWTTPPLTIDTPEKPPTATSNTIETEEEQPVVASETTETEEEPPAATSGMIDTPEKPPAATSEPIEPPSDETQTELNQTETN